MVHNIYTEFPFGLVCGVHCIVLSLLWSDDRLFLGVIPPNETCTSAGPSTPHKTPECVDLCGIDGVGGLSASHRNPNPRGKGELHVLSCFVV